MNDLLYHSFNQSLIFESLVQNRTRNLQKLKSIHNCVNMPCVPVLSRFKDICKKEIKYIPTDALQMQQGTYFFLAQGKVVKKKFYESPFYNKRNGVNCKIVRPLLNVSQKKVTTMCKDLALPVYPDKSNQSVHYSRNRIRKQILPLLKLFFNPQVEESLFKFSQLAFQEKELLSCFTSLYIDKKD